LLSLALTPLRCDVQTRILVNYFILERTEVVAGSFEIDDDGCERLWLSG
jgi:hypothetical protein